jgi:hypothetical protein
MRNDTLCVSPEARLLEIVLPDDGAALMFEAYFDESGTHADAPLMCVAGYLIEVEQCRRMQSEWEAVLARYDVPRFHMCECVHGAKAFAGIEKASRSAICQSLIELIKLRAEIGICVSVCEADYVDVMRGVKIDAYTYCVQQCMQGVVAWAERYGYNGPISYFFESGHKNWAIANHFIDWINLSSTITRGLRYHSHSFLKDGKKLVGIAAADMLAWHWCTAHRNKFGPIRRPTRLDFQSLMCKTHIAMHYQKEDLAELCAYRAARDAGENVGPLPEKFRKFISTRDVPEKPLGSI